jgi:hypothetical protein
VSEDEGAAVTAGGSYFSSSVLRFIDQVPESAEGGRGGPGVKR